MSATNENDIDVENRIREKIGLGFLIPIAASIGIGLVVYGNPPVEWRDFLQTLFSLLVMAVVVCGIDGFAALRGRNASEADLRYMRIALPTAVACAGVAILAIVAVRSYPLVEQADLPLVLGCAAALTIFVMILAFAVLWITARRVPASQARECGSSRADS